MSWINTFLLYSIAKKSASCHSTPPATKISDQSHTSMSIKQFLALGLDLCIFFAPNILLNPVGIAVGILIILTCFFEVLIYGIVLLLIVLIF